MVLSLLTNPNKLGVVSLCTAASLFGFASNAQADSIRIMSRAVCPGDLVIAGNVGHVAIAFYDSQGRLETKGMWPGGIRINDGEDIKMANGWGCRLRTRTAVVSSARRQWVWNQVATSGGTNCQFYGIVGKILPNNYCSCVGFATRVWRQVTSDWERWQFQSTPRVLGDTIQSANRGELYGIFDNGREWK
jgi:hypothetical protein